MELGTPGTMRAWLNGLVLSGAKRATAGTLDQYDANEFERVGERLTLVDDDLRPVGVIEVTATELTTFGQVPWSFAQAENEGDASLEEWRAGHRRFWEAEGIDVTDDLPVFLIYFDLVTPEVSGRTDDAGRGA
jgi:uncharacterized protein YhfF